MEIITNLAIVFAAIILLLAVTKQLAIAITGGTLVAILIFRLAPMAAAQVIGRSLTSEMTFVTVSALYLITYLQRMMESRKMLQLAETSLTAIYNNRRINATIAPIVIGMLPSAGAVTICGAIVDSAAENHLTTEEKTFVTSFFRHIPESILPTYSSVIIGLQLSGVSTQSFLLGMLPMAAVMAALGYWFYVRKIPKHTGLPEVLDKRAAWFSLLSGFWPLLLIILLILAFNLSVVLAVGITIAALAIAKRIALRELLGFLPRAFETKLILSTFSILIFKDIIAATKSIEALPPILQALPIPTYVAFLLLFFFGSIVCGSQSIAAIGLPLAFTSIPGAGMPLLILLQAAGYAAMQISPTHICLAIVTGYFKTSVASLVKLSLPVITSFLVILVLYYQLLLFLF